MNQNSDRLFSIAFGISLGLHLALMTVRVIPFKWARPWKKENMLDVVYEYTIAQQELKQLQEQLTKARREAVSTPSALDSAENAQIRIPDRPSLTDSSTLADIMPARSSVIDLTNLVDAARGNPVLLSYFSAIREQIQQTANRRAWLSGDVAEGVVYVYFVLDSKGSVSDASIVGTRSVDSQNLRDIALRIVKSAAPFPPFPPSIIESNKTVIVPLEFLLGSQG